MNVDFFSCAVRELKRSKRRTVSVFLGYMLFVSMLLLISNIVVYSKVKQDSIIGSSGTHFVTWLPACGDVTQLTQEELDKLSKGIIPEKCSQNCANCTGCNKKPKDILNESFVINTNATRLLTFALAQAVNDVPEVKSASPCLMFRFRDPNTNLLFTVAGIDPDNLAVQTNSLNPDEIIKGRNIAKDDVGKVVVDDGFAINNGLEIGDKFVISNETFEIIGIASTGSDPIKADFYLLFKECERCVNKRIHNPLEQEANVIVVETMNGTVHKKAMDEVKKLMKNDSMLTFGCYVPAAKALGLIDKLIGAFIAIFMLSAVLMAVKVQFSAVAERQKDIAVLKAIGWTDSVVLKQLVSETLIVSIFGCFAGFLLSIVMQYAIPWEQLLEIKMEPTGTINLLLTGSVFAFAVISGLVAGIAPVLAILRKRPMELLRRL